MKNEFFTEKGGLSATSAKYLSNLGQEKSKTYREILDNPVFYDTDIQVIGGPEKTRMSIGMTPETLGSLKESLLEMSKFSEFTAYIMEAIKEKDKAISDIKKMDTSEILEILGLELKEVLDYQDWMKSQGLSSYTCEDPRPERPVPEETDVKVLAKKLLGLTEYQEFLALDSRAAVLGKYCHDSGAPLVTSRADYLEKLREPLDKSGAGRDTCIYTFSPSVSKESLESVFEDLQKLYRETESKLNKIKYNLHEAEAQRVMKETETYQAALEAWNLKNTEVSDKNQSQADRWRSWKAQVTRENSEILSKAEAWRVSERNRVSKLKIKIPEALQGTYEYLESLGEPQE